MFGSLLGTSFDATAFAVGECKLSQVDLLPFVCLGAVFSFLCAVGIGANDLSANFAMVVGSGSLSMDKAIMFCAAFEVLGAAIMGAKVTSTLTKSIVAEELLTRSPAVTILGMLSASFASTVWLFLSSTYGLPVSITHTVVGSIIGFGLFAGGLQYIQLTSVAEIVASWIAAPFFAALVTYFVVMVVKRGCMLTRGQHNAAKSVGYANIESGPSGAGGDASATFAHAAVDRAYRRMPLLVVATLGINCCFVLIEQPALVAPYAFGTQVAMCVSFTAIAALVLLYRWVPQTKERALAHTGPFPWQFEELRLRNAKRPPASGEPGPSLAPAAGSDDVSDSAISPDGGNPVVANLSFHASHGSFVHDGDGSSQDSDDEIVVAPTTAGSVSSLARGDSSLVPRARREKVFVPVTRKRRATAMASPGAASHRHSKPYHPARGSPHPQSGAASPHHPPRHHSEHSVSHRAEYLFTSLQLLAGAMSSFVHGAVAGANATGPFIVLYTTYVGRLYHVETAHRAHAAGAGASPGGFRDAVAAQHMVSDFLSSGAGVGPFAISLAMSGIAVGMTILGAKLVTSIGNKLVTITPMRGFGMQFGGTVVTMLCTGIGLPVSLSQAQVGAAVGCGLFEDGEPAAHQPLKGSTDDKPKTSSVNWPLIVKLVLGWVATIVISATTTGVVLHILFRFMCGQSLDLSVLNRIKPAAL